MIKTRQLKSGFTIIEVMIVLAIAALILLVVFKAVPGLQRSQRNTARKQDAQRLIAAYYEAKGNFGGQPVPFCNGGDPSNPCFIQSTPLNEYDNHSNNVLYSWTITPWSYAPGVSQLSQLYIYNYLKCNPDGTSTPVGATINDVVAMYFYESGGGSGLIAHCQEG